MTTDYIAITLASWTLSSTALSRTTWRYWLQHWSIFIARVVIIIIITRPLGKRRPPPRRHRSGCGWLAKFNGTSLSKDTW